MSTAELVRYTRDDIQKILRHDNFTNNDELSWLTSVQVEPVMHQIGEDWKLAHLPSVDIQVIETDNFKTGIMHAENERPVIVLNEDDVVMDYDFISHLHPIHDAAAYLWVTEPYASTKEYEIHNYWFREDTYPDPLPPHDGSLGWADKVIVEEE